MEEQVSKLDASRTLALFSFRRQEGLQNICLYIFDVQSRSNVANIIKNSTWGFKKGPAPTFMEVGLLETTNFFFLSLVKTYVFILANTVYINHAQYNHYKKRIEFKEIIIV